MQWIIQVTSHFNLVTRSRDVNIVWVHYWDSLDYLNSYDINVWNVMLLGLYSVLPQLLERVCMKCDFSFISRPSKITLHTYKISSSNCGHCLEWILCWWAQRALKMNSFSPAQQRKLDPFKTVLIIRLVISEVSKMYCFSISKRSDYNTL